MIDKLGKEEAAEGAAQFAKLGVYGWAPGLTEFGPQVWSIYTDTPDSPEQPKVTKPAAEHSGRFSGITPRASTESQAGDLQEVQMELNTYASHCHSAGWFTGPNPNMDDYSGFKLSYFGVTGFAECIRATLALSGTPFKDDRHTGETWSALKATLPEGIELPLFEMSPKDGGEPLTLSQSLDILRFVGDAMYNGRRLYPRDPDERTNCDEVGEQPNTPTDRHVETVRGRQGAR